MQDPASAYFVRFGLRGRPEESKCREAGGLPQVPSAGGGDGVIANQLSFSWGKHVLELL